MKELHYAGSKFFRNSQQRWFLCAMWLVPCALAASLAGCRPDDKVGTLNKCITQVKTEAAAYRTADAEELHDAIGESVADCMKAHGYRHDGAGANCLDDVDFTPACYVPRHN